MQALRPRAFLLQGDLLTVYFPSLAYAQIASALAAFAYPYPNSSLRYQAELTITLVTVAWKHDGAQRDVLAS